MFIHQSSNATASRIALRYKDRLDSKHDPNNTHRNFSPDASLGRGAKTLPVRAEVALRLHDEDPVGGEAVDFVLSALPLGRLLAEEDVPRGVEPSREDLGTLAIPLSQDSTKKWSSITTLSYEVSNLPTRASQSVDKEQQVRAKNTLPRCCSSVGRASLKGPRKVVK